MKEIFVRSCRRASRAVIALLLPLGVLISACESDSVFEGEPTVAPPVAEFDLGATAETALHGGVLAVAVSAQDAFVGVDSLVVRYSGALQGSFTRRYSGAPKSVRVDTALQVPFGTEGEVLLETWALNRYGSTAVVDSAFATIILADTVRPTVTMGSAVLPERAELTGTMSFTVTARDDAFGGGLSRVGVAVRVGEAILAESTPVTGRGPVTETLVLEVSRLTASAPVTLAVQYYAWAVDQAGNCTAVGASGATAACTFTGGALTIPSLTGLAATLQVTATSTVPQLAPAGSDIGDLVVDVARRLVYASNQPANAVDAFSWNTPVFTRGARAFVGASPLGLTVENGGGRLIVANSGGTNLSYVGLGADFRETSRYETPNAALYQLTAREVIDTVGVVIGDSLITRVDTGAVVTLSIEDDFSDRPQYVAQDADGVIFYSTEPTALAPLGAVRRVEKSPAWSGPEAGIMLWTQVVAGNEWGPGVEPKRCVEQDPVTGIMENFYPCVITYVDSMRIVYESPFLGTTWDVWDHVPGRPDLPIYVRSSSLAEIVATLESRGSDAFIYRGTWHLEDWLTGERTFVTSSGNRSWVNIAAEEGRVWNWGAKGNPPPLKERFISDFVNIGDYSINTAARITGVSVNQAGSVFASRNENVVHFFTNPLRLLGSYTNADIAGGTGIAVHPSAVGGFAATNPSMDWAAVGTAAAEIALIDTRNFRRVGTIPLLEPVGGPLRVIGAVGTDPANVVAHIFGVTTSGAVFHVAVRISDINP